MISNVSSPNKQELLRNISSLRNPSIQTFEVLSKDDIKDVTKTINEHLRKSSVSVVVIRG